MALTIRVLVVLLSAIFSENGWARAPDTAAAEAVINRCVAIYKTSGHPCACPFDKARNGSLCGTRSAHDRPHGASPVCFVNEVTPDLLKPDSPALQDRCRYHGR